MPEEILIALELCFIPSLNMASFIGPCFEQPALFGNMKNKQNFLTHQDPPVTLISTIIQHSSALKTENYVSMLVSLTYC